MRLVFISTDTIRIGHPLPFPLMDKEGVLLAQKGFVIQNKDALIDISRRGGGLYIDVADSELHHRAYMDRLHGMVREGKPLGEIARAKITRDGFERTEQDVALPDWLDLQVQCNALLRDAHPTQFRDRLERLIGHLSRHLLANPDGTLFALMLLSAGEKRMYSATHAMLVGIMCSLAAREVLNWSTEMEMLVTKSALTMNLSMTDLQDRLAVQTEPLTPTQKTTVDEHAAKSAEMLMAVGVTDARWLEAVREHHTQKPGSLRDRTPAQQLARLVQRADMFAARLSPRASRVPMPPAAAMQACYFDENRKIDEAGAALIKAVGIYQPGSFVRLATDEVALVVKRGLNTTTPRVAVLINRNGMPTVEPIVRDSSLPEYRVVASVAHRDVKIQVNLERMLPYTVVPNTDRPW